MKQKLFTKSAFKVMLHCLRAGYYAYRSDLYANQNNEDEFIQSLADAGHQAGDLAKIYKHVDEQHDITAMDYDTSCEITREFLCEDKVTLAEAGFRSGLLYVRADIIEKDGDNIHIVEVKGKSWSASKSFTKSGKGGTTLSAEISDYVMDVAFQKYVIRKALKEMFPDRTFNVTAALMMTDKDKVTSCDGVNECFKVCKDEEGRTYIERSDDAQRLDSEAHVLTEFDVDTLCDMIIDGQTLEQRDLPGGSFQKFVEIASRAYCSQTKMSPCLSGQCFSCPFHKTDHDPENLLDGFRECWKEAAGFSDEDFDRPLVRDLNGQAAKRGPLTESKKYFLEQLSADDLNSEPVKAGPTLTLKDRNWLQIGMRLEDVIILAGYGKRAGKDGYLDIDGLREEMETWTFPLHMIDFETCASGLPHYKGMHPFEQVAFQFSHHKISRRDDGSYFIEHAGQYINTKKSFNPNFEFLRELKRQLEVDNGSIFRYATHENTILRSIRAQLVSSSEADKDSLIAFIDSITQPTKEEAKADKSLAPGPRNMKDLEAVVKAYFITPLMKGRTSIKVALPAVLNASKFLQDKYSKPIYGVEIPSLMAAKNAPKAWIAKSEDGTVLNPYKLLPPIASYLDLSEEEMSRLESLSDSQSFEQIANGGAALAAYTKLQFSTPEETEALSKALLAYCELDTMAMVFLWEYFHHEVYG